MNLKQIQLDRTQRYGDSGRGILGDRTSTLMWSSMCWVMGACCCAPGGASDSDSESAPSPAAAAPFTSTEPTEPTEPPSPCACNAAGLSPLPLHIHVAIAISPYPPSDKVQTRRPSALLDNIPNASIQEYNKDVSIAS